MILQKALVWHYKYKFYLGFSSVLGYFGKLPYKMFRNNLDFNESGTNQIVYLKNLNKKFEKNFKPK